MRIPDDFHNLPFRYTWWKVSRVKTSSGVLIDRQQETRRGLAYPYHLARTGTSAPSDDGQSSVASWARSNQDPYYSNDDIAILHAVVTAAQEQIDDARDPKPLPVAALFKAYDEVLPQHGVDPDSDHHLSTFVFRVGGERSDGTLIEKFQTILSRMGIVLEFGENTTVSARTSPSPAPTGSPSTRPLTSAVEQFQNQELEAQHQASWARHYLAPDSNAHVEDVYDYDIYDEDDTEANPKFGTHEVLQSARRAALSSVMNRWRNVAAQGQRKRGNASLATSLNRFGSSNNPKPAPAIPEANASQASNITQSRLGFESHYRNREQRGIGGVNTEGPVHRPSLLSAVDRWRTTLAQHDVQSETQESQHPFLQDAPRQTEGTSSLKPPDKAMGVSIRNHHQTLRAVEPSGSNEGPGATNLTVQNPTAKPPPLETIMTPDQRRRDMLRPSQVEEGQAPLQAREQRLMIRAARAREIYLASKVFNHWADRTARRLEREAVARRHMIRFRCFRGWSQAPNSRTPAVDHLRAVTATQKLQRAVAQNEEQLRLAAATAAEAYHVKKVQRALDNWYRHVSKHACRQRAAARARRKTLTKWMLRADDEAALREEVAAHRAQASEVNTLIRWQGEAERGATRQTAASQIGGFHISFAYLRDWWDQSETSRRAQAYRRYRLLQKTSHTFDIWSLQARVQAFMWSSEYLSVTRAFDFWVQRSRLFAQKQKEAIHLCKRAAKTRSLSQMKHVRHQCSDLKHLGGRARLYIGATQVLDIFDAAVAQRKVREREAVKRYLMMRYQQVSKERKKRNFFAALDRWRSFTTRNQHQALAAENTTAGQDAQRQLAVVNIWSHRALEGQQRHHGAQLGHAHSWLQAWSDASLDHEHQHIQAGALWAAGKQRQYQKVWSLSSLQQRGQAHTAMVLEQRHDRDKRNRALQRWRVRCNRGKSVAFEGAPDNPPTFGSTSVFRNSWRDSSTKRPLFGRREDSLMHDTGLADTPTRQTGQLFPMGSLLSTTPMPPVREADENTAPSSVGDEAVTSPLGRAPIAKVPSGLPSTTPRGPVPAHLAQEFGSRLSQAQLLGKEKSTPNQSQAPTRLISSQPTTRASTLKSLSSERGAGSQLAPRTLNRPAARGSVTVDTLGSNRMSSDPQDASTLRRQSVGALPQRQYVVSRRPGFERSEDRTRSTHAASSGTYAETGYSFNPSTNPFKAHSRGPTSGAR